MGFWDIKKKPTKDVSQVEKEEEETPVHTGVSSTTETEEDEDGKCYSCEKKGDGCNDYTCDICEEEFCVKCVVKTLDDHVCKKCAAELIEELRKRA